MIGIKRIDFLKIVLAKLKHENLRLYYLWPGVMWFSVGGAQEDVNTLVSESFGD